ncbi:hypothetical protein SRHO_G00081870 [Serrasalmus rhombeus]
MCECNDGYGGVRCDQAMTTFDLPESWDLAESPAPESVTPVTPATATQPSQPITANPITQAPPTLQPWQPKPGQRVVEVQWDEQQITDGSECGSSAGPDSTGTMTVSMETAEETAVKLCTGKDIDVAVLIDSNGKLLQEDKLFPGQTTSKIWCPKIRDAHRIISDPNLGTPKYIIIHTGTNDLRLEQDRVGGLVCRVADRAAESFPNAKIIVSTLLPRKDFHPATIQKVNADISRGCALSPPQPTLRAPPPGPAHPATPSRPALRPHLTTSAPNTLSSGLTQRPPPTRPAHQHQSESTPGAAPLSQDSVLQ